MSTPEDIKEKRLQRLALLAARNAQNAPKESAKPAPKPAPKPATKPESKPEPPIARKQEPKQPKKTVAPEEALYKWIATNLPEILDSSFDLLEVPADPKSYVNLFLEDNIVDRVILENLTEIGRLNPLEYLSGVWTRAAAMQRRVSKTAALKKASQTAADSTVLALQKRLLSEVTRLAASYGFLAFLEPEMFVNGLQEAFLESVLRGLANQDFVDYMVQVVDAAKEQESLVVLLDAWLPPLLRQLLSWNCDMLDGRYTRLLSFYLVLLSDKQVAGVISEVESFYPKDGALALEIELTTFLGPILRIAPLGGLAERYFNTLVEKLRYEIAQTMKSVQSQHDALIATYLFPICDKIVRGSAASRNGLLAYFATVINANHLRVATRPDYKKLSTHGFITNILLVLFRLAAPFTADFLKLSKIDADYFSKGSLLDISEETRVNLTLKEAEAYFKAHPLEESPNFILDCFFLSLAYLHYGIQGLSQAESHLEDLRRHLEQRLQALEDQLRGMLGTAQTIYRQVAAKQTESMRKTLVAVKAENYALRGFFSSDEFTRQIFEFASLSCVFLARAVEPTHSYPAKPLNLPLHPDNVTFENIDNAAALRALAPEPFRYYPEYCVQSIVEYVAYALRYQGSPVEREKARLERFIEFAVLVMRCPELVGNPHLKGKLVECLFFGSTASSSGPGPMMDAFSTNKVALDHLLYLLLDFYVTVEKTGALLQFYDKFNSRYHILAIVERLWEMPHYREQLLLYSAEKEAFFVRFVARMLNDTTYLLSELLTELVSIHKVSGEIEKRTAAGDPEKFISSEFEGVSMEDLQKRLSSSERQARSFIGLSNKTIVLFGLFTEIVPSGFTKPELVDRLAGMLNYNLNQLVGPRYGELKVKNPEKYQFNPRRLLAGVAKIYLNLSGEEEFARAVAMDGRSFLRDLFLKAGNILERYGQLDSASVAKLNSFGDWAERLRIEQEEEEEEWGDDAPDEFFDPLMATLMKEPVILPSSKTVVDLSTIKAHLLNDPTDPFNRIPLKLEQVVPDVELKQRIEAFKAEKRRKKQDGDVDMKDA